MILLVGGEGAGKRTFAQRTLGIDSACMIDASALAGDTEDALAIMHVQELVRVRQPEEAMSWLAAHHPDVVMIDEVGCGVVPIDAGERAWRERSGRLGCLLAERADTVVRLVCGLPQMLKGEL